MTLSEREQDLFDAACRQFSPEELQCREPLADPEARLSHGFALARLSFKDVLIIENKDTKLAMSFMPWYGEARPMPEVNLLARYERSNVGAPDRHSIDDDATGMMIVQGSVLPESGEIATGQLLQHCDFTFLTAEYVPIETTREFGLPWGAHSTELGSYRYRKINGKWHELVSNSGQRIIENVKSARIPALKERIFG